MSESPDDLYRALLKADRSESLGPIAAGLAKEFNDLLTKMMGAVHVSGPEALAGAEQACLEARDLTRRLGALATGEDGRRGPVGARELLETAARLAAAGGTAEVVVDAGADVGPVWVDSDEISQAFRGLVRNAVEAMHPPPQRPRVQLRAVNLSLPDGRIAGLTAGEYVEFEVRDNGCGIPPENLEKIWEPFFTTKKHASGLGLSAAMAIVRRHGGQIGVDSVPGVGTVLTVYLPSRRPGPGVHAQRPESERFRTGRILVMDDDPEIREILGVMLQKLGYKSDLAADGDEALAFYQRYFEVGRPHDAVLLDQTIRGKMGGDEVFHRLRALDPDVRAVASSGDGAEDFARARLALGYCGCLAKPFRLAELAEALKAVSV